MILIDGSLDEGGGAILRQSLALSIMTGKPFRITNIRKKRPKPGLKAQHLKSVELARIVCDAKVTGASIGSDELEFFPGEIKNAKANVNIGTAGSITLALQSVFIPMVFSGKSFNLKITGGTDVKWSPQIDYFKNVFSSFFSGYADINIKVLRKGYYPKGNGFVDISVKSKANIKDAKPLMLDNAGSLIGIKGHCHASKDLERRQASEKLRGSAQILLSDLHKDIDIVSAYYESDSTGGGITLYGLLSCGKEIPCRIGSSALLDKDLDEEKTVEEAVSFFKKNILRNAACDSYLADQLITLMAFTGGIIKTSTITRHVKGNIRVAESFTETKFDVNEEKSIITAT